MNLASGPFYFSAIFWAGAGVAIAFFTLLVIILQVYLGSTRRVFIYSLLSDTALLSKGTIEKTGGDLKVTLGGNPVENPHVVSLKVELKGRKDISVGD
jgi:hypothetical protein